ncbi:VOC family protein [Actinosynnema sp. NPDC020468]|uniref:VOC family protein n=1 Tax=Actinosynnema sp. NPDC020468 TaxID=3154488 RepID=UPI003410FD8F
MAVTPLATTFDCADPAALARFWAALLGTDVDPPAFPGAATVGAHTGGPFYLFQRVRERPGGPNRVHLYFTSDDLEAETDRLVRLGARVVREVEDRGLRYTTFEDPEGNRFAVSVD